MNSPLLKLLESAVQRTTASKTPVLDVVRTIVNSPVVSIVVAATPTPADDLILGFLQLLLPAAAPTAG